MYNNNGSLDNNNNNINNKNRNNNNINKNINNNNNGNPDECWMASYPSKLNTTRRATTISNTKTRFLLSSYHTKHLGYVMLRLS